MKNNRVKSDFSGFLYLLLSYLRKLKQRGVFLCCFACNALYIRRMKSNHIQTEVEGDLFSGLEEQEVVQPEVSSYDKIIESRKNAIFAAEQIERQEEVQVVEKAEAPATKPVAEELPKPECHAYPIEEVKAAA